MNEENAKKSKSDIVTHYGDNRENFMGSVSVPIFQTSIFSRKEVQSGYSYSRVKNPTIDVIERKLAALEKGEDALLFSSGMAALTASLMAYIEKDCHIACVKNVYLPLEGFFKGYLNERFGVETTFFEADDYDDFEKAVNDNTKIIYLESCVSNVFKIPDIKRICKFAKERDIKVIVDNTYATPIFCNPLELGADIVGHSCSKYIAGHSDLVAGALISDKETIEKIRWIRSTYGSNADPHMSWLVLRGMRTLPIRMERHMDNAIKLAEYMEKHPKIEKVIYPAMKSHKQHEDALNIFDGFPGLFCFVPAGGVEGGKKIQKLLDVPEIGPSWGGYETILNSPGITNDLESLKERGIEPGQIRISVGLEDINTLIEDFEQALEKL